MPSTTPQSPDEYIASGKRLNILAHYAATQGSRSKVRRVAAD